MTPPHDAPRFSVVMPLYNKAAHVRAAIESVFAQTFPPHEILVVDNRSTDGGREIVAAIGDARIQLLDLSTPGPGGYAGRNIGIRAARGDWIAFLDADDLWQPDHLAVLAEGIGADPSARAAATRFDHVFENRSQPQRIAPELERPQSLDLAGFLAVWLAVRECPMWTGAIAIRRDTLFEAGLFPEGRACAAATRICGCVCSARERCDTIRASPRSFTATATTRSASRRRRSTCPAWSRPRARCLPARRRARRRCCGGS